MVYIIETEYLEVNSVALATPAWWLPSLAPLREGHPLRGTNRILPGSVGRRARLRRRDETVKVFTLYVMGDADQNGTINSNKKIGLTTNIDYLKANLGVASTATGSLVTATWHRWDGGTKTAQVQVNAFEEVEQLTEKWIQTTLELTIPAGVFA